MRRTAAATKYLDCLANICQGVGCQYIVFILGVVDSKEGWKKFLTEVADANLADIVYQLSVNFLLYVVLIIVF